MSGAEGGVTAGGAGDGPGEDATARLRRELREAFEARAHFYRLTLDALEARLGAAEAEAALAAICEQRGREVAPAFAGARGAVAVGEAFLAASPDRGRLYPATVRREEGRIAFAVAACPLKSAWLAAGLGPARVAALCRAAGAFDKGLFEGCGLRFRNETWEEGREGCCRIVLEDGA